MASTILAFISDFWKDFRKADSPRYPTREHQCTHLDSVST